jgi:hypothetical protein
MEFEFQMQLCATNSAFSTLLTRPACHQLLGAAGGGLQHARTLIKVLFTTGRKAACHSVGSRGCRAHVW